MSRDDNSFTSATIENCDSSMLNAMNLAKQLAKNLYISQIALQREIEKNRGLLEELLEYLILNLNNAHFDLYLLKLLCRILGISLNKIDKKEQEQEEEKQDELTEEQKKNYMRWIIYEAYKIVNPNRIAGETDLENFISNVKTRGIKEAMKYTSNGEEYEKEIGRRVINKMDKNCSSFVAMLKSQGIYGEGRGM